MNKKILVVSILTIFMLMAITFATAIQTTNTQKKESPLYKIRTRLAIGERILTLKETIKAKFLGERLFFLPFQWLKDGHQSHRFETEKHATQVCPTCPGTVCMTNICYETQCLCQTQSSDCD